MNQTIDAKHLRQVGLTQFDIQLLGLLAKSGGEYPVPETDEGKARLQTSIAKNLVTIITRNGERPRVRLTDEGRVVVAQLEQMAVQPKLEVQSST